MAHSWFGGGRRARSEGLRDLGGPRPPFQPLARLCSAAADGFCAAVGECWSFRCTLCSAAGAHLLPAEAGSYPVRRCGSERVQIVQGQALAGSVCRDSMLFGT
ncbi:hypothetical protein ACFFX0_05545 [Citricoccus parietis]|uniref:Uncharacterized protein n=1 Tax=Citricoccus parietis TaxID=592307 RepID=A0ABV5FVH3_9MICC